MGAGLKHKHFTYCSVFDIGSNLMVTVIGSCSLCFSVFFEFDRVAIYLYIGIFHIY